MYMGGNRGASDGAGKLVFILAMLAGIVVGGFLGELLNRLAGAVTWLSFLSYLNYGLDFGLSSPFTLDVGIINLTLGFTVKFTICGIIGLLTAIFIYRRR